jgi:Tol biopolymer transport system component
MNKRFLFLIFCCSFFVINSHATFEVRWVGELNTQWHDGTPFVTSNGQTMYFSSGRDGGYGLHDIYRATLSGDIWVNITNVSELNTSANDVSPWIVGNYLYFSTDRWTGEYQIARATLNGGVWGNILPMPGFVQTGVNASCSFTSDGNTMYFSSNRQPTMGSFDIFKATNVGGNWVVTNLGSPIDTVAQEWSPSISPDGTVLHFCKMNRIGTWFLYVSKWNGTSWSVPELLPPPINVHPWQNETPCYRPEQNILWFVSDRTGSLGGHDIWKASNYHVAVQPTSLGSIKASFLK